MVLTDSAISNLKQWDTSMKSKNEEELAIEKLFGAELEGKKPADFPGLIFV